jgi:mgtE-like transporter
LPKFYDRSVLRQARFALAFDVGGIISGRIILVFAPLFGSELWIFALFPPVLSVRGNIGGIYSGKLSTMLHIGEAEPRLRNNSTEFHSLIRAIFTLTYVDTLGIGILAYVANIIVGNAGPTHFPLFVAVPVLTCLTAMVVAVPIVSFLGTEAFRRGLDPDIVLYPMMSTIDDIILTISYVLVVRVALLPGFLVNMATVVVVLGGIFLIIFVKHRGENVFLRTLTEGGPSNHALEPPRHHRRHRPV